MNPENIMIDFDGIITNGACRIMHKDNTLEIMPLPESSSFELQIDLSKLPFAITSQKTLECEDNAGTITNLPLQAEGNRLSLQCKPQVLVYRLIGESRL